ncbi:MAG: glycosyltransferase [Gammaproteobacteria bacterium]
MNNWLTHKILGTSLVNPAWYFNIKIKNLFSRKIKVGFGPITSGEDDLAERKWRIDPIINEINKRNSPFIAGFFLHPAEMAKFDIIVIVKKFTEAYIPIISKLKKQNKLFIYDIVDNPNAELKYKIYFGDCPSFSSLMDGFILSSPLHTRDAKKYSKNYALIEHPNINPLYKTNHIDKNEINILAHGYYENLKNLKPLEPVIEQIANKIGKKINLIYHSEVVLEDTASVKYVKWTVENCFTLMLEMDIAITIKNLHARHQRTKPSTKIMTFMAAALPVICTPTLADQLVMRNGVTGFFAYTFDDWKRYIELLAKNSRYRHQIAKSARASVVDKYSISSITDKYIELFNQLKKR